MFIRGVSEARHPLKFLPPLFASANVSPSSPFCFSTYLPCGQKRFPLFERRKSPLEKRYWYVEMEIEFPYVEEESDVLDAVKRPRVKVNAFSELISDWITIDEVLADAGADFCVAAKVHR